MLNKDQKKEIVKKLTEDIKDSRAVVFFDFKGFKVKDATLLRKELRKAEANFRVFKKTLLKIALQKAGIEMDAKKLDGHVAVAISKTDEVVPAKIIAAFAKKNENLKITGGLLNLKEMGIEEVVALAKLPSKEELLAKLVGTINAPVSGFVNVLAVNMRNLVQVLKVIGDSRQ